VVPGSGTAVPDFNSEAPGIQSQSGSIPFKSHEVSLSPLCLCVNNQAAVRNKTQPSGIHW